MCTLCMTHHLKNKMTIMITVLIKTGEVKGKGNLFDTFSAK